MTAPTPPPPHTHEVEAENNSFTGHSIRGMCADHACRQAALEAEVERLRKDFDKAIQHLSSRFAFDTERCEHMPKRLHYTTQRFLEQIQKQREATRKATLAREKGGT